MGYYVRYYGMVSIPSKVDEDKVVSAIKSLNHRHELKHGGRHPKSGDPYEDKWFSWLPAKFHEDKNINSIEKVFEMLGFRVSGRNSLNDERWFHLEYDNKIGQENIFLIEMAKNGVDIELNAEGEDGEKWQYTTSPSGELLISEAVVSWSDAVPAEPAVHRELEIISMVANAFVKEKP